MPSPEHAADLERVLGRAAQECDSGSAWFGEGLPQALQRAIEAAGRRVESAGAEVAFVELSASSVPPKPPKGPRRVVALSTAGLDELPSLIRAAEASSRPVTRLICPIAVLDFIADGLRVREIRHGLTAADLQQRLTIRLWAGPDLKEL
jgi:hypothetical protein